MNMQNKQTGQDKTVRRKLHILPKILGVIIAIIILAGAGVWISERSASIPQVEFAGGSGTAEDPYQIATADQLEAVNNDLDANYILVEDIDLSDYGKFTPIGTYVQDKNSPEGEDPVDDYAFTGTFDGNGHTIRNYRIRKRLCMGTGLFSCLSHGKITNLNIENADVVGSFLVSDLVGYSFESEMEYITVSDSSVKSLVIMAGAVAGGSTSCSIDHCSVSGITSEVSFMGLAGALGGGISHPVSFTGNEASNSKVTAKHLMKNGYCIGGLTGCINTPSSAVTDCKASGIVISVSGKGELVGGLTGGTGTLVDDAHEAALFENCEVSDIQINLSGNTQYVGSLLGGGMADEDTGERQTVRVTNCQADDVTITGISGEQESADGEAANSEDNLVGLSEYAVIE